MLLKFVIFAESMGQADSAAPDGIAGTHDNVHCRGGRRNLNPLAAGNAEEPGVLKVHFQF